MGATVVVMQTAPVTTRNYQFRNGQWFDGKGFRRGDWYAVNGVLTRRAPAKIDEVFDLQNNFVIPPFADAHTHNFDGSYNDKHHDRFH
jgi:cytosine/adenosine deaminase-related metal-dependent hydrolase